MKSLILSLKKQLHSIRISHKIMLLIMISTLLPAITLILILYNQINYMTLTETLMTSQEDIAKISPMVDQVIEDILACSESLERQPFYKDLFSGKVNDLSHLSFDKSEHYKSFCHMEETLIHSYPINHVRIYLDLPGNHPFFQQNSDIGYTVPFLSMESIHGAYWHGIFQGTLQPDLFCPSFYLSGKEKATLGDMAYIKSLTLEEADGTPHSAYMAIYFSSDYLADILTSNVTSEGSVFYIITDRDATVVTTNQELSGLYYQRYSDIYESLISSNNFIERDILGEKVYTGYQTISRPSWFLVSAIPKRFILRQSRRKFLRIALITLCIFIFSMVLAMRLSRSLGQRITSVIHTMSRTREGNLIPMEEPEIHDEIGDLISTYNYMTQQQKQLTENLKKTADELRVAEVNALQAQINPHFLYNTLDTIHWMAVSGKTDEISSMVKNLSRFYKLTLGKDMTNTTIKTELKQVSAYVELQNVRFNHTIHLIIDIPDHMEILTIPRLTLQPIVENAILHGIREKDSQEGSIIITGWDGLDGIYIQISDDGIGMQKEVIEKVLTREGTGIKSTGTNIAIYNVHHRLQLLYGNHYGLSYQSRPGEGTDVTIKLPPPDLVANQE